MSAPRYRIKIDKQKVHNWQSGQGNWYIDYENEDVAVKELADKIKLDLAKWQIYFPMHGSGLPVKDKLVPIEKRNQIIRAALLELAKASSS